MEGENSSSNTTSKAKTEESVGSSGKATVHPMDLMSKEELLAKYKGLLVIAKKAKQVKDELAEENRQLKESLSRSETQKEADKKALMTMKEMLEQFTQQKLETTTKLNELEEKCTKQEIAKQELSIENESLKRQIDRLTDDNEALLRDLESMENQLKQVNILGKEQKRNLDLLDLEVNKLKESDALNASLRAELAVKVEENKTLIHLEKEAQQKLEHLTAKYQNLKAVNMEQRRKFNSLKDRFIDVHGRVKKLKECKRILLETQYEYSEAVTKWQTEIIEASKMLCGEMHALKIENDKLKQEALGEDSDSGKTQAEGDFDVIINRVKELQDLSLKAEEENQQRSKKMAEIKADYEELSRQGKDISDTSTSESDSSFRESREESDKWEEENKRLEQEVQHLRTHLQDMEKVQQELLLTQEALRKEEDLGRKREHEKAEILSQLEKLKSEVSPQRQDVQEECSTVDKLKALEKDLSLAQQSYEDLFLRYEQKEREHADLLEEMRELNEALKGRGDVISRQQVKMQELMTDLKATEEKLQRIEQSLTEKEESISQKDKEVKDMSHSFGEVQSKVRELESLCERSEAQVKALTVELQTMAQNDTMSTSTISKAEEVNRMRDLEETFEDKYNKMRAMALKLKKKLLDQTAYSNDLEKQLEIKDQTQLTEKENEISELKSKQEEILKQVEELKAENQKLKSLRKQKNVLNLEIEAMEKSLKEASEKLTAKTNELELLNEALNSKENTTQQLRKEIVLLEQSKASELKHSQELKQQIDHLQAQIKDALHGKQTVLKSNQDLEQTVKSLQLELEDAKLQLSKSASSHESTMSSYKQEKELAELKVLDLENALQSSQSRLRTTERSLEDLRVEYTEYKVKAQAVLRKNQNKDNGKEQVLQEELAGAKAKEQELQREVASCLQRIEESNREIDSVKEENARLSKHSKEVTELVEELKKKNDSLAAENHQQMLLQQESIKNHRQQIDNLDLCYRKQIEELQATHEEHMEALRAEMENLKRQPPSIEAATANATAAAIASGIQKSSLYNLNSEQAKIDLLLMEREDAEGSEEALATIAANRKISTTSQRSSHDFMPLDELLNMPMTAMNDTVTTIPMTSFGRRPSDVAGGEYSGVENSYVELQATKERLQIQESRVRHLTALLAENEQDLARLTQMNDMLKEELRRQERGVEREKHMHNSEYLKNVILKFLTLSNNDERTRLVPVLNTILKLSRNETEILNCVARGQKVPSESGSRGWTNFLPSWGSGNGGGN